MWPLSTLFSLRFFAEISDVDRQNSTRVGQFCVARVLVGRFDEAWKKTLQVCVFPAKCCGAGYVAAILVAT